MKLSHKFMLIALVCQCSSIFAASCEDNFKTEGDPRNGAEYFAAVVVSDVSVESALGQLQGIATADGFKVLNEESNSSAGKLTIEQSKGSRPFLIYLTAAKEGEANAALARKSDSSQSLIEIKPADLAKEVFDLSKKMQPEIITARYKGKRYLLDGQISSPLYDERVASRFYDPSEVQIWYKVARTAGWLTNTVDDRNSIIWPKPVCFMVKNQIERAKKLKENDWAKLSGTVSRYSPEVGNERIVLENCKFE
jgi:hypothetical protein